MNHDTPAIERERQREIYDQLVNKNPLGVSRKALVAAIPGGDRVVRDNIEAVKILAATIPHRTKGRQILGFDPVTRVYAAAQDPEQAARIIDYQHSRVKAILRVLAAQLEAYEDQYGEPAPSAVELQATIFEAAQLERRVA